MQFLTYTLDILAIANLIASKLISVPLKLLFVILAATPTKPEPQNGSITNSPLLELCSMRVFAKFIGFLLDSL